MHLVEPKLEVKEQLHPSKSANCEQGAKNDPFNNIKENDMDWSFGSSEEVNNDFSFEEKV